MISKGQTRMNKKTIIWGLTALLMTSSIDANIKHKTDEAPFTEADVAAAEQSYNAWFLELNKYLLASDDSYNQTMGIAALVNILESKQYQQSITADELATEYAPFTAALNKIIKQQKLNNETTELLRHLCFSEAMHEQCFGELLLEKTLDQYPDNLTSYLQPLHTAVALGNEEAIFDTMSLMATAKHCQFPTYISQDFDQTIDRYINKHSIPESAIKAIKADTALLSDLSVTTQNNLDEKLKTFLPTSIKTSYALLNDMPNFKPVLSLCQQDTRLTVECLKIAQIMIDESNAVMSKGIGYAILIATHEANDNQEVLERVKANHERFKTSYQCYFKASRSENFMEDLLDPKYHEINLSNIDEYDKIKQLAHYTYNKYKDQNPELLNPDKCE